MLARQKNPEGSVGFANLPNQVYRKSVNRGFEFSFMVVGECGLGKLTLTNSLFLTDLYSPEYPVPFHRIKKTVQVEQSKVLIKEGGVQLLLTILDTLGFGEAVDNCNCWQPVIDYIDSKFDDYLNAELRVNRRPMPDNRVQCCLYFIAPSEHGLKPLDIEFMKHLQEKVNVIPLTAKADTLTPEECHQFKKRITKEIQEHKIKIHEFPETDDEEENKLVKKIKDGLLAVVGSNAIIEVNGRQYSSGAAEVENGEHSNFTTLRNMLMLLIMFTVRTTEMITRIKGTLWHKRKMEEGSHEMEQVFEMKVKEDSEAELQRHHEQMEKNLDTKHKELEEKRHQFEDEKVNWENSLRTSEKNKKKRKIFFFFFFFF
uniref:Septin n=1 Tax=Saimiri boliviensis boliviensis TaxID=39432 RepID=A0A2K6T432_SAIBB